VVARIRSRPPQLARRPITPADLKQAALNAVATVGGAAGADGFMLKMAVKDRTTFNRIVEKLIPGTAREEIQPAPYVRPPPGPTREQLFSDLLSCLNSAETSPPPVERERTPEQQEFMRKLLGPVSARAEAGATRLIEHKKGDT
jgi:hypothetical protein